MKSVQPWYWEMKKRQVERAAEQEAHDASVALIKPMVRQHLRRRRTFWEAVDLTIDRLLGIR